MSYPMCRDLQAQTQFFDGVLCRHPTTVNLSSGGEHQPVLAEIVSGACTSLLVLLACSNVASLLLARGAARGREVVTRIALGASRGRITNQLLIEGIVISLAGGLLGIAAAPAFSAALLSFLPRTSRARA